MHKRFIHQRLLRQGLLLVVAALLLYLVVPQIGGLAHSWDVIANASKAPLVWSAVLLALTFPMGACEYQLLALRPLRFWPTLLVQIGCGLAGKLLPAGLGSLGLNATYLHRNKHSTAQAAVVVGANNLLGFAGYVIILLMAIVVLGVPRPQLHIPWRVGSLVLGASVIVAGAALIVWRGKAANWLRDSLRQVQNTLRFYVHRPLQLLGALIFCIVAPMLFTLILWYCALSVGTPISLAMAFAVFSTGLVVGTVTPTPGGIGGAEAGLVAALIAYGLSTSQALIVALLYRFVTYWLPMVPGGIALFFVRKQLV